MKRVISINNASVPAGRLMQEGRILITMEEFKVLKSGDFAVNTASYLLDENAINENDETPYFLEGYENYKIKPLDRKTSNYSPEKVQEMFVAIGKEIKQDNDFYTQLNDILSDALLLVVASENTYGVPQDGWQLQD